MSLHWFRHERKESERFSANLPEPDIIDTEIVEDLKALAQFTDIASDLRTQVPLGLAVNRIGC